jgi:exodeoxyribonuclease V alpha subunit
MLSPPFSRPLRRPSYAAVCSPAAWSGDEQTAAPSTPLLPLLLDGDGRLYLHRYFAYERRLAEDLRRRARRRPTVAGDALRGQLDELFAANAERLGDRPDWQKLAAALAWRGCLTIISGGPGTGKTTTVVALLACLLGENPGLRIALAAPTGKAAARMLEALRQRAGSLAPELQALLPRESHTLHRLLGVTPEAGRFRHHAGNPLPIDALVVDEASMLDLALACRLCEAVPPAARLILLGDKDQLAAVEAGAVFAEISADPTLSSGLRRRTRRADRDAAIADRPAARPQPDAARRLRRLVFRKPPLRQPLRGLADWPARSTPAAAHRRVTGSRAAKTGRSAG